MDYSHYTSELFDIHGNYLLEPVFDSCANECTIITQLNRDDLLPQQIIPINITRNTHTKIRAQKRIIPDSEKDERYWKYRIQNTISARKCRAAARLRKLSNAPPLIKIKNKEPKISLHKQCKILLARLSILKLQNESLKQEIITLQQTKSDLVQKVIESDIL